jgi:hypothetical protein
MASGNSNRIFSVIVAVAAMALLAFSWYTRVQNVKLQRYATNLLRAREYPQVVTGLKIDILAESALLDRWPPSGSPDRKPLQALVIATSDTCGFCKQNLPHWEKLLAGLNLRDSQEVWLMTFNTAQRLQPIVQQLKARNVPFRVLAVKDPLLFSLKTGIVGVPMTFVLGEDSSVELICHGQMGDREIQIFQGFLSGSSQPKKFFLASADQRTEKLY